MNKELEEFKKETLVKLKDIKRKSKLDAGEYMLDSLMQELKPKPEFIEGEVVLVSNGGDIWEKSFFVGLVDREYKDACEYKSKSNILWKFCKKIEALPMHMTKYDGTNKPDNNLLAIVKSPDGYDIGLVGNFDWNSVIEKRIQEFQILKDLNP